MHKKRYVVMDQIQKFNRNDFITFIVSIIVDALLTSHSSLAPDTLEHYQAYTKTEETKEQ